MATVAELKQKLETARATFLDAQAKANEAKKIVKELNVAAGKASNDIRQAKTELYALAAAEGLKAQAAKKAVAKAVADAKKAAKIADAKE
jgi:hypothetical protein